MMFGRVEAVAEDVGGGQIRVSVYLETGRMLRTVRSELVPALGPVASARDLAWNADQYAQETIANELALEGWEVIGGGEIPEAEAGAMARSATYAVRRLASEVEA